MSESMLFGEVLALYRRERLPSVPTLNQMSVVIRSLSLVVKPIDQNPDNFPIFTLKRESVMDWRDWLLEERQLSRASWNNYLRHLRVLVNFSLEMQISPVGWNPVLGVKTLPVHTTRKKTVDAGDLREVLRYLHSPEGMNSFAPYWFWSLVIRTFYYTGMRRKQLCWLRWGDVSFDNMTIRLRAESSKTRREWQIPLPAPLVGSLRDMRLQAGVALKRTVLTGDQVFNVCLFNAGYGGKVMTEMQVSGFFRRLKDATDVELSPHRFRHTFGTALAKSGQIRDLQQMMGHTDVRTTLGYVEPDMEVMRELLGGLGDL